MCDLLGHVLLRCPCAELAGVRAAWLADVELTLEDAGLGAWWASLPPTLEGRGAAALGHLTVASGDEARRLLSELTRLFVEYMGGWWAANGGDAVARLATAGGGADGGGGA